MKVYCKNCEHYFRKPKEEYSCDYLKKYSYTEDFCDIVIEEEITVGESYLAPEHKVMANIFRNPVVANDKNNCECYKEKTNEG